MAEYCEITGKIQFNQKADFQKAIETLREKGFLEGDSLRFDEAPNCCFGDAIDHENLIINIVDDTYRNLHKVMPQVLPLADSGEYRECHTGDSVWVMSWKDGSSAKIRQDAILKRLDADDDEGRDAILLNGSQWESLHQNSEFHYDECRELVLKEVRDAIDPEKNPLL